MMRTTSRFDHVVFEVPKMSPGSKSETIFQPVFPKGLEVSEIRVSLM